MFSAIFDSVSDWYSPGRCMKCHSVEGGADSKRTIHWWPARAEPDAHPFTTFAHGPHFNLLGGHQCGTCHALDLDSKYQQSYLTPDHALRIDASGYTSNFLPIEKETCVACHTASKAGDSCLLCHNYHVGQFAPFQAPRQLLRGFPSRSAGLGARPADGAPRGRSIREPLALPRAGAGDLSRSAAPPASRPDRQGPMHAPADGVGFSPSLSGQHHQAAGKLVKLWPILLLTAGPRPHPSSHTLPPLHKSLHLRRFHA